MRAKELTIKTEVKPASMFMARYLCVASLRHAS